jgi:hypothetical protein
VENKKIEQAPELTAEEEKILDKIWLDILHDEDIKEMWTKNPPNRR